MISNRLSNTSTNFWLLRRIFSVCTERGLRTCWRAASLISWLIRFTQSRNTPLINPLSVTPTIILPPWELAKAAISDGYRVAVSYINLKLVSAIFSSRNDAIQLFKIHNSPFCDQITYNHMLFGLNNSGGMLLELNIIRF